MKKNLTILLLPFLFILISIYVYAVPNAPSILKIEGKNVIPAQTTYLNITTNITVEGTAETNKAIKIYDGAALIGTGTSNSVTGTYAIDVNLAAGSHTLTATASEVFYDGTLTNGPVWTPGKYGSGLQLDGNNDYVIKNPFTNFPSTELTAEFWMNSSDNIKDGAMINYLWSAGNDNEFLIHNYNNFTIYIKNVAVTTGISATDGLWHHIAVTWRSSDGALNLYKDGVPLYSGILQPGVSLINNGSLVIGQEQDCAGGCFSAAQAFLGIIDEVKIYNRVLTGPEVLDRYNNNTPILNGLNVYWNLDENAGITAYDTHTTAGESAPSTPATVLIDTTLPGVAIKMIMDNGYDFSGMNYVHTAGWAALRTGASIQGILSDAGGSGFDISTATMKLEEVDDFGTVLATIPGSAIQLNPTTVKFLLGFPFADGEYQSALSHGKRYRITATVNDFAGNQKIATKDFVIDNVMSALYPGGTAFKLVYVFDADDGTITNPPPMAKLVPMLWVAGNNRWEIDPAYVNPALVDWGTAPHSLKFNHIGLYGSFWAGDIWNPPVKQGYDTPPQLFGEKEWTHTVGVGYLSPGPPDANGNNNTFFYKMTLLLLNGINNRYLDTEDTPRNSETSNYQININDPNPITAITSITNWNNASIYKIGDSLTRPWTTGKISLTPGSNVTVRRYENLNGQNIGFVVVPPAGTPYTNTVGVYDVGDSFMDQNGNQVWDAGEPFVDNNAKPANSDGINWRIDNVLNAQFNTSGYVTAYYYAWTATAGWGPVYNAEVYRVDQIAPIITGVQPNGNYYKNSADVGIINVDIDSRPYGSLQTAFGIQNDPNSKIEVLDNLLAVVSAGVTAITMIDGDRRYWTAKLDISGSNYLEGKYTIRSTIRDTAPNLTVDTSAIFYVDKTAPNAQNIVPGPGAVSSIPSFNADIVDPDLINAPIGTAGSGPMLDLAQNQIDPYKKLGAATTGGAVTNTLTVPVLEPIGGNAVDHRGNAIPTGGSLPAGAAVQVWKTSDNSIVGVGVVGNSINSNCTVTANGGASITIVMSGALTLDANTNYTIFYLIPHFDSNDGVQKIASVPLQPAIAAGTYASRITAMDKVGNTGTTVSITSIQLDPPSGTITLTPVPQNVYIVSAFPNERTEITSSVIQGGGGTPVSDGTLVTISLSDSNLGDIVEPDANGIGADGYQIATGANGAAGGTIKFHVKAKNNTNFGTLTVSAQVGSASGNCIVYMRKPIIALTKTADKTSAPKDGIITYTIQYQNTGNSDAVNTVIQEKIPTNTTYEAGTIKVNGAAKTDAVDNPDNGDANIRASYDGGTKTITVSLANVIAGATGTIEFKVKVN